jgi:hypothetical protein
VVPTAGEPQQLGALPAADVEDPPRRRVREPGSELARDELLADDLAERAEAGAPGVLSGGEFHGGSAIAQRRAFVRRVGSAVAGSSGHGCRGYRPRSSARTLR